MKWRRVPPLRTVTPAQFLALGYLVMISFGTLLLLLPISTVDGQGLSLVDSLFTATSATAVTGLVVVTTGTHFTLFGQLVVMFLIQVGGLGIMTVSTLFALFLGKKIGLKERMIIQEDLNQLKMSGVVRLVKYILFMTLIIEGTGALLLFFRLFRDMPPGQAFYFSVFHSISAFNNAGFDLFGNSLENYAGDLYMNLVMASLILLGGMGFTVIVELFRKKGLSQASLHTRMVIRITLLLLVTAFLGVFFLEMQNPDTLQGLCLKERFLASFFLSVTPRTAGFHTIPTGNLQSQTLFLLILLMFIGASPGSTGGGIKTTTFGCLLFAVLSNVRGKQDVEIFQRRLSQELIFKSLSIAFLSLVLILFMMMILSITEDSPFLSIFFETFSAFGTVGLSTGITSDLSIWGRLLITITMFCGRLGPLTLALAFSKAKGRQLYRYPEEKIMVG